MLSPAEVGSHGTFVESRSRIGLLGLEANAQIGGPVLTSVEV